MRVDDTGPVAGAAGDGADAFVLQAGAAPSLVVPGGADFLLNADFARAGDDLVLTGPDGSHVTVRDFFVQDTPPVLETAGGARVPADLATALAGPANPGMLAQAGGIVGGDPIGTVKSVHGEVFATRGSGTVDTLLPNDPVFQGDIITTGDDSQIGIVFVDGTNFSVAANARMVLDNLVYGASLGNEGMGVSVLQGAFAFITGSIAKGDGDGMSVRTPVATIGIRGTTVNGDVQVEGAESRFTLTPDFVTNHVGVVEVRNAGGTQMLDQAYESTTVYSFFTSPTPPQILPPVDFDAIHGLTTSLLEQIYQQYLEDEHHRQNGDEPAGGGGGRRADNEAERLAAIGPAAGNADGPFHVTLDLKLALLPPLPKLDFGHSEHYEFSQPFTTSISTEQVITPPPTNEEPHGVVIHGTDAGELLEGTEFDDVIFGGGGDDRIYGFGGNDILRGEDGDDFVDGGSGNDDIIATPGADTVLGGSGNDVIDTGEDDDTVTGGAGNDTIDGGSGDDTAKYSGAYDNGAGYDIRIVDGTVTIADTNPGDGDDGTDTLTNVEHLQFTDVTLDITNLPTVSVADVAVDEDAGTVTFTLTKTGTAVLPLTVAYATADGTAQAGSDYTAVTGSVIFAPGETEKTVVVPLTDDGVTENTESFSLVLSDPVNGSIGTGTATATITDNDTPPVVDGGQAFTVAENSATDTVVGTVTGNDADGNTLQGFQIVSGNDAGFFQIDAASGAITVAAGADLNFEDTARYTLGVTVSDGALTSAPVNVTVDLTDQNEAPAVDGGQSFTIAENSAGGAGVGTVAATDPDGNPAFNQLQNYQIVSGNDAGFFQVDAATGAITVAPGANLDFEDAASYALGITVSDGTNTSAPVDVTINVTNQNETPSIDGGLSFAVAENSAADTPVGTVIGSDPDGDTLQGFQIVTGNDAGFFQIDSASGDISVAAGAALNFEDTSTFTLGITASDGSLTSAPVDVTINVTDQNETPIVISEQTFSVAENSAGGTSVGTVAGSDPDGDTLQGFQIVTGNDAGFFQIDAATGAITVAPGAALDFEDTDTYTLGVTASDGSLTSDPVDVTVNVTDRNETPSVDGDQSFTVAENSTAGTTVGTVTGSDPDGDTLQGFQIVSGNDAGFFQIDSVSGAITVAAGAELNFENTNTFTLGVTASDGSLTSNPVDVTVNVADQNESPSVNGGQAFAIAENSAADTPVGTVTGSDPEGNTLQNFQIVSGNDAGFFQIDAARGAITVAAGAALDFETIDSYTLGVTVSDGTNTSEPVDITIGVTDENETPAVAGEQTFNVAENSAGGTAVGAVVASDPDTNPTFNQLQGFQIVSGNDAGYFQIDAASGAITVAAGADLNFEANDTYTLGITVSDGTNTSDPVAVAVTINDQNETPNVIGEQTFNVAENSTAGTAVGTVVATDPDGDPAFNQLQGFQIVSGNDAGFFQIDAASGAITVVPGADLNFEATKTYSLGVTVSDGTNTSNPVDVTVDITDQNESPSGDGGQSFTVAENSVGGASVGTVAAGDPDTDPAFNQLQNFQIVSGNEAGFFQIDAATGAITVAAGAALDFETIDSYTLGVTVSDGANTSDPVDVAITITDENEAPAVVGEQTFSVSENSTAGTTVGTVAATDPDSDPAFNQLRDFQIVSGNDAGFFQIGGDGTITVAAGADLNFEANDTYTLGVTVSDGANTSDPVDVTVNVSDINEAPSVIAEQVFSVAENSAAGVVVGAVVAADPDTNPAFNQLQGYQIVSGNDAGFFQIAGDGTVTVAAGADLNFEANDTYTLGVTVSDGTNTSAPVDVTITIGDVNEAPSVVAEQTFAIAENSATGTVVGAVMASDPDTNPAFNQLQGYQIVSGNDAGFFQIAGDGSITVAAGADLNFEANDTYTLGVTVSDGTNTSAPVDVTITVGDVNEAPSVVAEQAFSVAENSAGGTVVGAVAAADPDTDPAFNQLQGYHIVSGNDAGFFQIAGDGTISVAAGADLNFEANDSYTLGVTVSDGTNTSAPVDVTVNVRDVNEAPSVIGEQAFSVAENSAGGTVVGAVMASDPDTNPAFNQLQDYQIVSGNDAGFFEIADDGTISLTTGTVSIADDGSIVVIGGADLNYEVNDTYTLGVTVSDGTNTSDPVDVTINVLDVPEPSGSVFSLFVPPPQTTLLVADGAATALPEGSVLYLGAEFADSNGGSGVLSVARGEVVTVDEIHVGVGGLIAGDGTVMADVYYDGGVLAPGDSTGTLTIDGNLDLGGHLQLDIGGTAADAHDMLAVTGDADLHGDGMTFSFNDGFLPQAGDSFDLVTVDGNLSGTADGFSYQVDGLADGFRYDVSFDDGTVVLTALNDANAGNDVLNGSNVHDIINGGAGNDILIGGAGSDDLTGGSGADLFMYKAISDGAFSPSNGTAADNGVSGDTITDFNPADGDKIGIDGNAFGVTQVVDGQNFAVIGGTYDGTNGAGTAWDAGDAAFIADGTGTLYYDDNGADPGYTIVAETPGVTPKATDLDVQNT